MRKVFRLIFLVVFLAISSLIVATLSKLIWVGLVLVISMLIISLFKLEKSNSQERKPKLFNSAIGSILGAFMILITSISLRLFVFEIFFIPSSSMKNSIIPGDVVLVNKWTYGAIIPQSPYEIPWINILFYLTTDSKLAPVKKWWRYSRLKGFSTAQNGDVIVYFMNKKSEIPYIKRCVASPGDTLEMKSGRVLNRSASELNHSLLIPIELWTKNGKEIKDTLRSMGVNLHSTNLYRPNDSVPTFKGKMDQKLLKNLRSWSSIDSLVIPLTHKLKSEYLKSINSSWTIYDFGPLVIPKKGMTIDWCDQNHKKYSETVCKYEGVKILKKVNKYYFNNKENSSYTFKNDYFFMVGDNRNNSVDSRYSGLIPKKHIIGKAELILFSSDSWEIKWERIFKCI